MNFYQQKYFVEPSDSKELQVIKHSFAVKQTEDLR